MNKWCSSNWLQLTLLPVNNECIKVHFCCWNFFWVLANDRICWKFDYFLFFYWSMLKSISKWSIKKNRLEWKWIHFSIFFPSLSFFCTFMPTTVTPKEMMFYSIVSIGNSLQWNWALSLAAVNILIFRVSLCNLDRNELLLLLLLSYRDSNVHRKTLVLLLSHHFNSY